MLIMFFSLYLKWLPPTGMVSLRGGLTGLDYIADLLSHLILPTLTLGLRRVALITRLTRASMMDELSKDYILTAKAKGLPENAVVYDHALKNALLPVVTIIGMQLPNLISGSVLVETVFSWPGIGRLTYESLYSRDYPILMGVFIFTSLAVILSNLVTDILCAYLDPRIRYT